MHAPPLIGDALTRSLVRALGNDCQTAAAVARLLIEHNTEILDFHNTPAKSASALERVINDFVARGWLARSSKGLKAGLNKIPAGVASFLEGAAAMLSVVPDDGRAVTVVTMPHAPSIIAQALPSAGIAHASLVSTQETFERIADAAEKSLTIMTPFVNLDGLMVALELFRRTKASQKSLIIRYTGDTRLAISQNWNGVNALGVRILDYKIPTEDGYETFHAKVLLADQDLAYVGSANMTVFARHAMELGVLIDGRAARVIANVIRAIEAIAHTVQS